MYSQSPNSGFFMAIEQRGGHIHSQEESNENPSANGNKNLFDFGMTPEQFEIFTKRRRDAFPEDPDPLKTFSEHIKGLPMVHREAFFQRATKGILPEEFEVDLSSIEAVQEKQIEL